MFPLQQKIKWDRCSFASFKVFILLFDYVSWVRRLFLTSVNWWEGKGLWKWRWKHASNIHVESFDWINSSDRWPGSGQRVEMIGKFSMFKERNNIRINWVEQLTQSDHWIEWYWINEGEKEGNWKLSEYTFPLKFHNGCQFYIRHTLYVGRVE